MSETDIPDFDELDSVEVDSGGNGEWINLDVGEEVTGVITGFNPDGQDYGVVEIDGNPYSLNKTQRDQMFKVLIEDCFMGLRKLEDEESFTNDDGETVTYNPTKATFGRPPGGDN